MLSDGMYTDSLPIPRSGTVSNEELAWKVTWRSKAEVRASIRQALTVGI